MQTILTVERQLSYFDRCSLSNLDNLSHKFWAHLVSVYVVTIIVLRVGGGPGRGTRIGKNNR